MILPMLVVLTPSVGMVRDIDRHHRILTNLESSILGQLLTGNIQHQVLFDHRPIGILKAKASSLYPGSFVPCGTSRAVKS